MSRGSEEGGASRVHILVVEDDHDMRTLLAKTLEQRGYRVKAVESATEALEAVVEAAPALAIVDIRLPDFDGCELVDRIREKLGDKAPPAVLLSVYVDKEYPSLGSGVVAALPKAFSLERLLEIVAENLSQD